MIRVFVVDDHPAVRSGLVGMLRVEPGFVPVGAAATGADALSEVRGARAGLVLVDYNLPDTDGLLLTLELKQLPETPAVVIYTAFPTPAVALGCRLVRADGLVDKAARVGDMFDVLRRVRAGELCLPPLDADRLSFTADELDPLDVTIMGLATSGEDVTTIADLLGEPEPDVLDRLRDLVRRFGPKPVHHRTAV
jgi:DNA-binding NarL/FixJ family response regulator